MLLESIRFVKCHKLRPMRLFRDVCQCCVPPEYTWSQLKFQILLGQSRFYFRAEDYFRSYCSQSGGLSLDTTQGTAYLYGLF